MKSILLFSILSFHFFSLQSQKIGFLLGSYVSDRWYVDQKLVSDHIEKLGGECKIGVAYSIAEQLRLAESMIDEGAQALIIVALDAYESASVVDLAAERGIPVIAYDRFIFNSKIDLFITYDNEKVGQLQGEYMANHFPKGNYLLINGPESDHNAIMFRKGQLKALQEKLENGEIQILDDYVMDKWSELRAFERTKEFFTKNPDTEIQVILTANDALAQGVIKAIPVPLLGSIGVSGQDADLKGIENIIAGYQSMTVYKPIRPIATKAAEFAMKLASKESIDGNTLFRSGNVELNTYMLDPMIVDTANYKETVIKDGHVSLAEVATNLNKAFERERDRLQLIMLQNKQILQANERKNLWWIFGLVFTFLTLFIAGLVYLVRQKQKTNYLLNLQKDLIENKNKELEKNNLKLQDLYHEMKLQQEEISAQRDANEKQNEQLQEVYQVIAAQKKAIEIHNQKLEKEVRKKTAELVEYNKQLEQYAFVTSHKLRGPVARIMGLGSLLESPDLQVKEKEEIIQRLSNEGKELEEVFKEVNKVLNIKIFSKQIRSRVNLESLLQDILFSLQEEIEKENAELHIQFSEVNSLLSVKPYLHSIFFHLINNAIKFRHPTRKLTIEIGSYLEESNVILYVKDNGLGIDLNKYGKKLFYLYERFHEHIEGRGVGLFLIKNQIEALGGQILVESEEGKGTLFKITLKQS